MAALQHTMETMAAACGRLRRTHPAFAIWWLLRLGAAMCFIGHGAFGVIGKEEWLPFFAVAGMSDEIAWRVMPFIGAMDIALGISVLLSPRRFLLLYMAVWAIWTAALRPLAGDTPFEMLERAGNYGIPMVMLLLLGGGRSWRDWFTPVSAPALSPRDAGRVTVALTVTTALLLAGHGALAAISRKPLYAEHANAIGLDANAAVAAGWLEIALAILIVTRPRALLLLAVAGWKIGTELLFPLSGALFWEFIERGGSYAAPLALALLLARRHVIAHGRSAVAERSGERAGVSTGVTLATLALFAAMTVTAPALGQQPTARGDTAAATARTGEPGSLLSLLREGGYVIVLRHTATDHSASDRGPAREQQRNLSAEGERLACAIGAAIRRHRIPIGEVRANPMYRNRETAELAFGSMVVDPHLGGAGSPDSLRAMMSRPVARGQNLALVTRTGVISAAFREHDVPRIDEGDAVIVRPLGEGRFAVVAIVRVNQWETLATITPRPQ